MFWTLITIVFIVIIFNISKRQKSNGDIKPEPPGPMAWPILGNAHLFRNDCSPFVTMTKLAKQFGDVYSIKLGSNRYVVVSSVDAIKNVLIHNGNSFGGRPDFLRYNKLFAGDRQNSLAFCDWCNLQIRRRSIARKQCDPKRQSSHIKTMVDVGSLEMNEMVSDLRLKATEAIKNNQELDFKPIIMRTCLNIFTQYMCSIRFDTNRDSEFRLVVRMFDEIFWDINRGRVVDIFPWLSPFYSSYMKKLNNWSTTIRRFILTRIINLREIHIDDDEEEKDFTDSLLKALKQEKIFSKNAILFALEDFLGGSSAIGNLVCLMLGFIARHPDAGMKIQREIDELTSGLRPIRVDDVDHLPYTTATVKETLRYISSPIVPHVATKNVTIKNYVVMKGTIVIINNYVLNMDDRLWTKPLQFNPDRFLERTSDFKKETVSLKKDPPYFIPFSIGKRTCLGRGMVINYSVVTLATILQNFKVSTESPENIKNYTACAALPPDTFRLAFTSRTV